MNEKIQGFVNAFINFGSVDSVCDCGKHYYETEHEEELDDVERVKMRISGNCVVVDRVRIISLMGKEYVEACDCWHEQVERVMGFVDTHRYQIAGYLNAEKERLLREANVAPTVAVT